MILCGCKNTDKNSAFSSEENKKAKQIMQGIWVSDDDGSVVMKVKGDSIIYADTTLTPVTFAIYGDTLITKNFTEAHYAIIKQTPHIFQFASATGDSIRLIKSDNPDDSLAFVQHHVVTASEINQRQTIKRDTVLRHADKQYHAYVQVNPSTYKVIISSVNESGLKVDNVYYDNIINIALFQGERKLFSKNMSKQDFSKLVPASFLQQSILSDITIEQIGEDGVHFLASILQPDSETSYIVNITISYQGKISKQLSN